MSLAHFAKTERFLYSIEREKGPILLIVGGMHGNEPASIKAVNETFSKLKPLEHLFNGSIYAIKGNLNALKLDKRYIDTDLNRVWAKDIDQDFLQSQAEYKEFKEIKSIVDTIKTFQGDRQFILLDLHTTSAASLPFILSSNVPRNRRLVIPIPVPTVLGVENRIKGTLMDYFNNNGDCGIVFEAGAHLDPNSVKYHSIIIQLILVISGILNQCDLDDFEEMVNALYINSKSRQNIFEITYRYGIKPGEKFKMNPGYENFMKIEQGEVIASNQNGAIITPLPGRIFMPLYQSQGSDGFFIVKESIE